MNMSYCRFQNTVRDLDDCYDHINEPVSSDEEVEARKRPVEICKDIVDEYDEECNTTDEEEDEEEDEEDDE